MKLVLFFIFLSFPLFISAETYYYEDSGFSFWVPENWTVEEQDEEIAAYLEDKEILAYFFISPEQNIEKSLSGVLKAFEDTLDKIETGEIEEDEINQLKVIALSGRGLHKDEKKTYDFGIYIYYDQDSHESFFAVVFAKEASFQEFSSEIAEICLSVKKDGTIQKNEKRKTIRKTFPI
ncbi:MAG TPA: hypothetical protein DHW82_03345 [Spirochaetia bacterium]|nr:MAG: hypothetical protein A2Y41_05385 [Spirochaetes bacterium GWB1_36_13]HCL56028.1 hypothetical protein [Spirochaetia bacterium]